MLDHLLEIAAMKKTKRARRRRKSLILVSKIRKRPLPSKVKKTHQKKKHRKKRKLFSKMMRMTRTMRISKRTISETWRTSLILDWTKKRRSPMKTISSMMTMIVTWTLSRSQSKKSHKTYKRSLVSNQSLKKSLLPLTMTIATMTTTAMAKKKEIFRSC